MAAPVPEHVTEAGGSSGTTLVVALVALLALTGLSWWLANVPLGTFNTVVALAIAAAKASIVALCFMELAQASTTARIVVATTVVFIVLLCLGIVGDEALR
jgi:cytochrome c oxidase subunit 4